MDIQEAYKTLEVSDNISDEDLKKKYKELAKIYHPDLNKDQPDRFKKINEAFQMIADYRAHPEKYQVHQNNGFWSNITNTINFADILFNGNGFVINNEGQPLNNTPIQLHLNISFKEAILGCDRHINYMRQLKCVACGGKGFKHLGNGCDKCDGFGRIVNSNNGFVIQTSCSKCYGRNTKKEQCKECKSKRTIDDNTNGNIAIPPGVENGATLKIAHAGNYIGSNFFQGEYGDVLVHLNVSSHPTLKMQGVNVLYDLPLTLLEALEGAEKEIDTINGKKTITIKAKTKNKEQVILPKLGVKDRGDQIINVSVSYPEDSSKLIEILKNV